MSQQNTPNPYEGQRLPDRDEREGWESIVGNPDVDPEEIRRYRHAASLGPTAIEGSLEDPDRRAMPLDPAVMGSPEAREAARRGIAASKAKLAAKQAEAEVRRKEAENVLRSGLPNHNE